MERQESQKSQLVQTQYLISAEDGEILSTYSAFLSIMLKGPLIPLCTFLLTIKD